MRSGISRYDLVFNDVADRDAGYYKYVWGRLSDADEVEFVVTVFGGGPLSTHVKSRKGRPGSPARIIGPWFGTYKSAVKIGFGGIKA